MITKDNGEIIDINKGLIVKDGVAYQMFNAKVDNLGEVVDFTNNDKTYKMFPINNGLIGNKEEITLEPLGNRTTLKVPGSTTYSGDVNFGGFTSSFAYICSLLMRGETEPLTFKKGISLLYAKNANISIIETKADSNFSAEFKLESLGATLEANAPIIDDMGFTCTNGNYADSKVFSVMNHNAFVKSFENGNIKLNEVNNNTEDTLTISTYYKDNSQDIATFKLKGAEVRKFNKIIPLSAFVLDNDEDDLAITMVNSQGTYIDLRYSGTLIPGLYKGTGLYAGVFVYVNDIAKLIRIVPTSELTKIGTDFSVDIGGASLTCSTDLFTTNNNAFIPIISEYLKVDSKFDDSTNSLLINSNEVNYVFSYGAGSKYKELFDFINSIPNLTLFDFVSNFESDLELDLSEYGIIQGANAYNLKGTIIINAYTYGDEIGDKHGSKISIFQPVIQDPILNNMLLYDTSDSGNENVSQHGFHYTDVEYKNLNLTFANKGLTNITSTASANKQIGCSIVNTTDIDVSATEKTNSILAQTTETPTIYYVNGMEAKYIKDATFTMEWIKDDTYNIEVEKFIRNNTQYNWNWGANAVLNDVSRKFMEDLNNGLEHSLVIAFERKLDGKNYKFFIVSTSITGVVQEPTIARGELTIALSNVSGSDKQVNSNMLSNFIIAFHDDDLV